MLSACGYAEPTTEVEGHQIRVQVADPEPAKGRPNPTVFINHIGNIPLTQRRDIYRKAAEKKTGCSVIESTIVFTNIFMMMAEVDCSAKK